MRGRRFVVAAVLAGSALCPLQAESLDPHALITRCVQTAGANVEGLTALRKSCPGIDRAVASLDVSPVLPARWADKASTFTLADLDALAGRYSGRPSSAQPAASALRAMAIRLQQSDSSPTGPSLWSRIKAWLSRRLAPAAGLFKWLRSLPARSGGSTSQGVLLTLATVLLAAGVVALLLTWLRAADRGDTRRRRRGRNVRRAALSPGLPADGTAGDGIDPELAFERPASALRMLIEALRRSRRIERDGNLTCREVVARAAFDTPGQREGFAGIAVLAERELFGPRGSLAVPHEQRAALQGLYNQLSAAPSKRAAAS